MDVEAFPGERARVRVKVEVEDEIAPPELSLTSESEVEDAPIVIDDTSDESSESDEDVVDVVDSDGDDAGEREEEKDDEAPPDVIVIPDDVPVEPAVVIPKNKGGRPRHAAMDITRKLWSDGVPASTKIVADLLTNFFKVTDRNNTTDAASRQMWELFRMFLPNGDLLPKWDEAQVLLIRASPVKAKHYVVCTNYCMIHQTNLEMMTDRETAELKKAKCPQCKLAFANEKGQFNRVSTARTHARACSEVATFDADVDAAMQQLTHCLLC
jgi:hypothetical protein